jgi:hypothetical protein
MHAMTRLAALAFALLACAVALTTGSAGAAGLGEGPSVMTRNLYHGADLTPALTAIGTCPFVPPAQCQSLVLAASAGAFAQMRATDFPARAQALAQEVDDADPFLIGLQEVALWRTGPIGDPAPATAVEVDFLPTLLAALNARGLRYAAVSQQQAFDVEAPAGAPFHRDVRLTVRDVVLARTDLPRLLFSVSNPLSGAFAARISVPNPAGGTFELVSGWASIDVRILGRPLIRFVNTHLEAFNVAVREAQAAELVASPALTTPLAVILAGDLNSDPGGAEPGAYAAFTAAGLADTGNTESTCCHAADLLNPAPTLTRRIDHVLVRPAIFGGLLTTRLVGADPANRAPSAAGLLWPSDHAGVVARIG